MDASQTERPPGRNFGIVLRVPSTLRSCKWLLRGLSVGLWLAGMLVLWHLTPVTPRAAFWYGKKTCLHGFSPDGNTLISTFGEGKSWDCAGPIHLWDVPSGRERAALANDWWSISNCQFSPDGTLIAALNEGNHLKLWETATGKEKAELLLLTERGRHACAKFSPDGRFIIYQRCDPEHVYGPVSFPFWEIETQQVRATIGGRCGSMEIAADGKTLSFTHWEGEGKGYKVERWRFVGDPQVVVPLQTVAIPGNSFPRFSPNLERCVLHSAIGSSQFPVNYPTWRSQLSWLRRPTCRELSERAKTSRKGVRPFGEPPGRKGRASVR